MSARTLGVIERELAVATDNLVTLRRAWDEAAHRIAGSLDSEPADVVAVLAIGYRTITSAKTLASHRVQRLTEERDARRRQLHADSIQIDAPAREGT
jgi:hypothetical protein